MIKFQDLSIKKTSLVASYLKIFRRFINKGQFILGEDVERLEKKISIIIDKKYVVGVSSGTNALYLALKVIGIKANEQVLVPCLSWLSTFTAVKAAGAIPVGIDLIKNSYSLDIKNAKKMINKKTKAMIIVHYTGLIENVDEVKRFCKKHRIHLIEDCAQSFGAKFKNKPGGSYGDISCFSMNPMKIYAGFGDAGFVATNSKKQYETLKSLRYAGTVNRELCVQPDLNHKIDTFDANILNFNLRYLRTNIKFRINKAKLYSMKLSKVEKILTPKVPGNFQHVYYSYQILAKNRDSLKKYLLKNGVETKIQHKYIISDHPGLKNKFNKNTRFLNGNKVKGSTLSLPIHSKIKSSDILKICNLIKKFYQNK